MRLGAVLLAAALLFAAAASAEECNLRCWLRSLRVAVPPISFSAFIGTFNVTNLTMWGIEIGHMNGDWYPDPAVSTSNAIELSANGVVANISASWSFTVGSSARPTAAGTLATQVHDSSMALALAFHKSADGLIDNVTAPECKTDLKLGTITFTGDFQWLLDKVANILKDSLLKVVDSVACDKLPQLVEQNFTAAFREANKVARQYMNETEPLVVPVPANSIDVRTSPVLDSAGYALNRLVGVNGPLNLTYLVGIFSNGTGTVTLRQFRDKPLVFTVGVPSLDANITIGITDVVVRHLDTWNDFRVLEAISPHVLRSYTDLADLGINVSFFVNVTADDPMISDSAYLYEEAWLSAYMASNTLTLQTQAAAISGAFANYSDRMCLTPSCVAASLNPNGTALIYLALNMTFDYIRMTAAGSELEADVRKVVNTIFSVFVENYRAVIPPLVNGLIGGPGLSYANSKLSDALSNTTCPYVPDDPYSDLDAVASLAALGAAIGLGCVFAIFPLHMHYGKHSRAHKATANTTTTSTGAGADETTGLLARPAGAVNTADDDEKEAVTTTTTTTTTTQEAAETSAFDEEGKVVPVGEIKGFWANFARSDREGASLYMDARLNVWVRALMPMLLFVNAAMFVSSNTGLGASVFPYLTFGDKRTIRMPSMFDFGLINSVVDMWKAGVYPLSILVAVFSGIWPYTKLLMMLFVWVLPVSSMPKQRRETWLIALDVLGKWSLLDSYIMIMMLVAFHIHVEFPIVETAYLEKPTMVDLYVYPARGFLLLMTSTIVSLLLSHVMMGLHRSIEVKSTDDETPEAARKRSLFLYCKPRRCVVPSRVLITVLLLATALMFFAGSSVYAFSFDFKGLTGWALDLMNITTHTDYSVVSLGESIPPAAHEPNSATVRFTQFIFMFVTLFVPFLHIVALNVVWLVPMTRKLQNFFYQACEVMYAWSCMDVFVVSLMAAVLEIGQFALFMVGDRCDFLQPILEKYFADILGEYNQCFEVIAVLGDGCWILFSATIFYSIVSNVYMRICRDALAYRALQGRASTPQLPTAAELHKHQDDHGSADK